MFMPLITRIKNNCSLYPKNIALSYKDQVYSYVELNQRSNQLAHYLQSRGIKKASIVAIISENYLERVVSIIAIWKLGAAYLPIEPSYPLTRVNFILDDAKISFIITDKKIFESIFSDRNNIFSILLEREYSRISTFSTDELSNFTELNDIAYIAYTSGSTGNPKGAVITQRNVSSIYCAWEQVYELTSSDKHLQIANFGFDVCTGDIIRAFGSGAQLTICPSEIILQSERLYELLVTKAINVAEFTPPVLRKLVTYLAQKRLNLNFMRLLICGSDSWSLKEYSYFKSFLSQGARLINSYGTTEATIDSSYFELNNQTILLDERLSVPIGRPFSNTTIKILNNKLECCAPGIQGEIYIGGSGVSLGYLNRPDLTREKFVTLRLENDENKIFYKTGDLGCYLSDGNISFLGRIDDQIKIMDSRVNLFEIESVLNSYQAIQKVVVNVHFTLESEDKFLIVFIKHNQKFIINDFISFLKKNLSASSIPSFYRLVFSLPVSHHGKLDRKKLSSELIRKKEGNFLNKKIDKKSIVTSNIEEASLTILKNTFNIQNLDTESSFFSLDTNSLLLSQLLKEIEIYCNLKLKKEDLMEVHTVSEFKKLLQKNRVEDKDFLV